jgi:hypothetical protein
MIAHIHRGIDRQQEEAHPQRVGAAQQLGIGAQQQGKGFAVAELVVAPFLEPGEDRVEAQFRLGGQLAIDRDIARVADLFRQIDRIKMNFGLK